MENVKSFLYYFVDSTPGSQFTYQIPVIIIAAALIIGSIVFSGYYKKKKKSDFAFKRLFKHMPRNMMLMGILFVLLLIVRYENIPYFAMRLWLYLSLILLLYLVYRYVRIYTKVYPVEKLNAQPKSKKQEKKYLPNKKKK